jgi:CubicO group peptidase (beta-lactamase class C family)
MSGGNTMTTLRSIGTSSLLLLLLAASPLAACSDRDETQSDGSLDPGSGAHLEALADRAIDTGIPGVSVAVVSGDQTVLVARGVADRATNEELTPDHRFRVARGRRG